MEEIIVTGIVLNTLDYKDNDVLIHLFSVELGNLSAILKGVKKPKAKLKYASQPFCFGKFQLIKKNEFYIVKTIELIDTFYDLTLDYDTYTFASSYLEICNHILKPNIISESLFLLLIKTLNNITYNMVDYHLSSLKFYLDFLDIIGYKLNFDKCDMCGMRFIGDIRFNYDSGTFRCAVCPGTKISQQVFSIIKFVSSTPIDKISTLKFHDDSIKEALRLVLNNISLRLSYRFKSITSI